MKKGKEFIFPENVDKDYGIWKDYTLKDFGYAALAGLVGLIFIAIPPYGLILVLIKIVIVVLAMTIVMAILTIRPVSARKNIKVRDHFNMKRRYANSQKLFYLKPKKRGELIAIEKDHQTK
ncbi:conjugal transfer protein [Lacticaseibacillus paracasei]|uniref:conjugal transfer protein n=1 Tax=Lacticaseibacillus paracasei TaxID=1597 RepID=UPI0025A180AC|nr:conjugal transfer protein [Lacticaseibacillus paracasei]MDM7530026.1 conjugal transfer protein [Lacticaseibacillus paracasei]